MTRSHMLRTRRHQRGFAIGGVIVGIALLAVFAGASYQIFGNNMSVMNRMTREDHNFNLVRGTLRVLNTQLSDTDSDGAVEMPAWLTGTGPSDGGVLQATFPGQRSDAWGSLLGYCNWDHGSTNASTGRIAGTTATYEALPIVAIISPGPNRTFQTTCADAYAGTTRGDDLMMRSTVTEASTGSTSGGGDLWTEEGPTTISYGSSSASTNRVGIGTATPGYAFTVNTPEQQQGISLQTGQAGMPVAVLRGQSANNDEGELVLYQGGAENVRLSTGGLPELHLGGWLREQAVGPQAMFGWNVRHNGSNWSRVNADGGAAIRMHGVDSIFGAGGGGISFHASADGTAGSTLTQMDATDIKMGINANGVGIRLTNPTAPLTVRQANNLAAGGNAGLRIENSNGTALTQIITGSDNYTYLYNGTGSNFLSMTSTGNVGIGTNSTGYKLDVNGDALARGWMRTTGATGWYNDTYAGGWFMSDSSWIRSYNRAVYMAQGFDTSSGVTSGIGCNGGAGYPGFAVHVCGYAVFDQTWAPNFHNAASYLISGACWAGACASDIRLKDHVRPFELGLDALLGIDLVYYRFNGLGGMDATDADGIGVIAQQVEQNVPQLIKTKMVKMHKDDSAQTEIKQVDYTALPWMTMNAVKELNAKVDAQALLIQRQAAVIDEQRSDLAALKEELQAMRRLPRAAQVESFHQVR